MKVGVGKFGTGRGPAYQKIHLVWSTLEHLILVTVAQCRRMARGLRARRLGAGLCNLVSALGWV